MTCSFLSPKSNPKSVYAHLRSAVGSSSSSASSLTSPTAPVQGVGFGLRRQLEIPLFYVPAKGLRSRARGSAEPRTMKSVTCPFAPPFPAEFLATATNLSSSTATGPEKVAYSMLKHLPRSCMDFFLHIFNLSWHMHSFRFI